MAKLIPNLPNYDLQDIAGKANRLSIYADRNLRGFEKIDVNGPPNAYEHDNRVGTILGAKKAHRAEIVGLPNVNAREISGTGIDTDGYTTTYSRESRLDKNCTDYISIIDIDFKPGQDDDKRTYSYLKLPFVPRELNYSPESNFVGIASFGRNNPFYQFTGSEDTLTFEIDWFSERDDREDVIFNCRWLEALSKSDGYDDVPHRVILSWGMDNKLFSDSIWLVTSAPYRLTDFVRGYQDENTREIISVGMLPQQAYQQVTLKRLSNLNRTTKQIISNLGRPKK